MKIIDLVVIGAMVFFAARGSARGFWLSTARMFGVAAALFMTWTLHPVLKSWLRGEPQLLTGFQEKVLGPFLATAALKETQGAISQLAEVLNRSELPGLIKKMLLTSGDPSTGAMVTLNETTLSLISFATLLMVSMLIIQTGFLILDRLFKLPGLSLVNRLAGMLLGLSEGIILVWVTLTVLTPWIAFKPEGALSGAIRSNQLTGWFYQHNVLLALIDLKFK